MLASTRSSNSVRTISGKGAVFIEARVTEVTHHKGRIYVRSFTQLTFYTTESLGGLRNKRSTYMCRKERVLESTTSQWALHSFRRASPTHALHIIQCDQKTYPPKLYAPFICAEDVLANH